jgi:hypothetical protein
MPMQCLGAPLGQAPAEQLIASRARQIAWAQRFNDTKDVPELDQLVEEVKTENQIAEPRRRAPQPNANTNENDNAAGVNNSRSSIPSRLRESSSCTGHFMANGDFTRFAEWRFIHRARLDSVPLNATRRFRNGDRRCRRC